MKQSRDGCLPDFLCSLSLTWLGLLRVFCKTHVLSEDAGKLDRALALQFGLPQQLVRAAGIKRGGEVSPGRAR